MKALARISKASACLAIMLIVALALAAPRIGRAQQGVSGENIRVFLPLAPNLRPLVLNGSFDSGDFTGWTVGASAANAGARVVNLQGDFVALLGDPMASCAGGALYSGAVWLHQTLDVPRGGNPTLSMQTRLFSQDDERFETLNVYLQSETGVPMTQLLRQGAPPPATLCDSPTWDSGWREARYSLVPYEGQRVQLYIELRSIDDTGFFNTWAYVDDIVVNRDIPTATPSVTPTVAVTASPTATRAATATRTATAAPGETASPTPTRTATRIASATSTSAPPPSASPTNTLTRTPSATTVPSQTATRVPSATATASWTATVPPTETSAPTWTATPTSTPTQAPLAVHVGDLDADTRGDDSDWEAIVEITVHTEQHGGAEGVRVTGVWSDGHSGTAFCNTNGRGECTVRTGRVIPEDNERVVFTVTSVTGAGYVYSPDDNHDPDGDSDGTTIIIEIDD